MLINKKIFNSGDDVYYKKEFMTVLESHMVYLREHPNTISIAPTDLDFDIYVGDLYGYLNSKNIPPYMHWTIMRMSNLYSSMEFSSKKNIVRIPSENILGQIKQIYIAQLEN